MMPMKTTTTSPRNRRNEKPRPQRSIGGVISQSMSEHLPNVDDKDDAQAAMLAELEALVKLGRLVLHQ
jgi:hypothetical protein